MIGGNQCYTVGKIQTKNIIDNCYNSRQFCDFFYVMMIDDKMNSVVSKCIYLLRSIF